MASSTRFASRAAAASSMRLRATSGISSWAKSPSVTIDASRARRSRGMRFTDRGMRIREVREAGTDALPVARRVVGALPRHLERAADAVDRTAVGADVDLVLR